VRSHGSQVQVLALSSGVLLQQAVPGEALVCAQEDLQQEAGAGQQEHRNVRLYNASIRGDLPTVIALIAEGADVNDPHPETRGTPLHVASQKGHLSVVNALIAARAVVDRVDADGFTALMMAAACNHEAVVSVLHRVAGASVHHANNQGATAMHMAAQHGHVGVVRVLLRARDNPNVVTTGGRGSSPLNLASSQGHLAAVRASSKGAPTSTIPGLTGQHRYHWQPSLATSKLYGLSLQRAPRSTMPILKG
jgi:ankyrin repeat protein